ncbi:MAG TPA: ribose 5-phosphate isomerase B [Vicinamibacteria bacterium]|nr:ribose 5-phosphate isomerase B [Vicinamibacteria bacterium]
MARRRILTGDDVRALPEGSLLDVTSDTILTDVAREWVERRKIRLVETKADRPAIEPVRLALGSDHAGFELKETLKGYLLEVGAQFQDYGTHSNEPVDYPDFAHAVALAVAVGHARQGIVVDGAGMGSAIVANKVPGVRAAACYDEAGARNAREHNDVNVLTLGSRNTPLENVRKIVAAFLTAEHSEPRHRARVAKIVAVESKYSRPA